jgi:hypothetical protein
MFSLILLCLTPFFFWHVFVLDLSMTPIPIEYVVSICSLPSLILPTCIIRLMIVQPRKPLNLLMNKLHWIGYHDLPIENIPIVRCEVQRLPFKELLLPLQTWQSRLESQLWRVQFTDQMNHPCLLIQEALLTHKIASSQKMLSVHYRHRVESNQWHRELDLHPPWDNILHYIPSRHHLRTLHRHHHLLLCISLLNLASLHLPCHFQAYPRRCRSLPTITS